MPHSKFKNKSRPLNLGLGKCPCGQAFNYASERDLNMKLQMHHNVCPHPPEGFKCIRTPKKAMMLKEVQHNEAERIKRVQDHH